MVENVFNNESAESICFSNAINSELTRDDEPTTLPTTINVSHQASSAISDALLAEIEQNVENGTISHFNLEDKCERFAARLGEYKVNDGGRSKLFSRPRKVSTMRRSPNQSVVLLSQLLNVVVVSNFSLEFYISSRDRAISLVIS
jgi:hypothetical protein